MKLHEYLWPYNLMQGNGVLSITYSDSKNSKIPSNVSDEEKLRKYVRIVRRL